MQLKTKKKVLMLLLCSLFGMTLYAQSVSGTVTDAQGVPLPGVNILVKGTTTGTQTDFDGNYTINADIGSTLVFSYLGMKTVERNVGSNAPINISMKDDAQSLDEVVVTALGISREKKSLGYATQEVGEEELTTNKSGNFVNALSGKASGIQIRKNNNLGGSTNVVIRGTASLTQSNQALFVIDGVPINNTNTNSQYQGQAVGNYYDYGNTASDINPDDIESINVLKGAAATALYGSRAANGVIMITTKKGKKQDGIGITLSSSVTVGDIDKSTFAKYQNQYGAGYGPYYSAPSNPYLEATDIDGDGIDDLAVPFTEDASYGAAFDPNLLVYQWDALDPDSPNYLKATPWMAAKNGPITFFETPITLVNSVSFSKASDVFNMRLNYTKFDQEGLMPNSQINKHNFSFNGGAKVTDKFNISAYANMIQTKGLGRNSTGYNDNIMSAFKQWWQTNVDVQQQRDIYFQTRRNVTWNPASTSVGSAPIYWDNPYWTRYENYQNDKRNRFIGNITLNYQFNDWLSVMARVATDSYSELQEERRANGSVPASFGIPDSNGSRISQESGYARRDIRNVETNYDLTLNFNKNLSEDLNLKAILGANIRRNHLETLFSATSGGLGIPKLYSLQNSKNPLGLSQERDERIGVDGIFASASLGYKNMLYLDATIRRDHSSTLPEDNSTFYYPSVATSFVFTKLVDRPWLTFGKLRANYAEVGNSAPFDFLYDSYNVNVPPGSASASVKDTKNNPNLKPEITKSIELGLEAQFFKNRLGFDVAYYKNNSVDQIFGVPVSTATGFAKKTLNAGEIENKGVEVSLSASPIRKENFEWRTNINWSKNTNTVVSLEDGIENLQLGDFQGGITINARAGEPYGVIQGTDYTYLNGKRVVDASNGQYVKTTNSDNVLGDVNPDWLMGISNNIRYKNWNFSFLIDIQQGGSIFSLDQWYGQATGIYAETAFINDLGNPVRNSLADGGGFINEGVNADGSPNTTRIRADRFGAFGYRRGLPHKAFVYDASYVKLREVALTFNFPDRWLQKIFFTNASVSFTGSNLWIISKDLPHADPESGLSAGNLQGYSVGSLPTTRDFGMNVKLQF
ncbi:MAG: SusC/RagA family TonB-linked outer membrane protein [Flavobacteriaceae bacterium]|nr:SusC/RagA family TonB-linked outer membrane protein [Flavobacteriaceae bacterium]